MKIHRQYGLTLILLFSSITLSAQMSSDWTYSLGVSFRTFDSIEFKRLSLTRPDGGTFVNGHQIDRDNFFIQGDPQLDPIWLSQGSQFIRNVTYDKATFLGDEEDADNALGVTVQARRNLGSIDWLELAVEIGIYGTEADTRANNAVGLDNQTRTGILSSTFDPGSAVPTVPYEVIGGFQFLLRRPQHTSPLNKSNNRKMGLTLSP